MALNSRSRLGETLLQQLVEDASGDKVATPVLLRTVKILAARLKVPNLADWVEHELNGYGDGVDIPSYRGPFPADVKGDFVGGFGARLSSYPIPPFAVPDELSESFLFKHEFHAGVSELEDLVSNAARYDSGRGLGTPWPPDAVGYVNLLTSKGETRLDGRYQLVDAWKPISPSAVRGVLDAVRNRILDLALALESADPAAGEPESEPKVTPQAATQIFNTVVYGAGNVAIGSSDVAQVLNTTPADDNDLVARLDSLGVSKELLDDLRDALASDREEAGGELDGPGSRVWGWLKKLGGRAADAGGDVAVSVIKQLVLKHLGLDTGDSAPPELPPPAA